MTYEVRFYRDWAQKSDWVTFEVIHRESDLQVRAHRNLQRQADDLLTQARGEIERHIARQPAFAESFSPLPAPPDVAPLVKAMLDAATAYDVGPMAAVAGAVAQTVGEGLLRWSPEVIVENGGDIYVKMNRPVELGLYAGADSPFSGEIRFRVDPAGQGLGVCTSSGTVGHSISAGHADAVVAIAEDAALADATATAIGNRIASAADIERMLNEEKKRGLLKGLLIAVGKKMGAFGDIELMR